MTVFVIDIDSEYGHLTLPFIKKVCEFNGVNLYVLKQNLNQNVFNLHPSWLKLFCHEIVEDDFVICWDLDLVPTRFFDLKKLFNQEMLNLSKDWSLFNNGQFNRTGYNYKFQFNCGLIGIPKSYDKFFRDIYYDCGYNSFYPSYEQYHVNDKIFDTNQEVNVLDPRLNYFKEIENYPEDVYSVHYTWKIKSNQHRIQLIENHNERYKKKFDL